MQSITAYNIRATPTAVLGLGVVNAGSSKAGLIPAAIFDIDALAYRDRAARIGIVILDASGVGAPTGYNSVTGVEALATSDRAVVASTSGADYALTLMAASAVPAGTIVYFYFASGANTVTITRAGADTIDGGTTLALATGTPVRRLQSNGLTAWVSV